MFDGLPECTDGYMIMVRYGDDPSPLIEQPFIDVACHVGILHRHSDPISSFEKLSEMR